MSHFSKDQVVHHIGFDFKPMYIAPFKDGFLFTTSNDSQLFYFNFDEVQTFAGGGERSSRDGTALYWRFYTQTGITVKFEFEFEYKFAQLHEIISRKLTFNGTWNMQTSCIDICSIFCLLPEGIC